jgi:hypothetical protein
MNNNNDNNNNINNRESDMNSELLQVGLENVDG